MLSQTERGAGFALGHAEAIHRCSIDQIDTLIQSGVNGFNTLADTAYFASDWGPEDRGT